MNTTGIYDFSGPNGCPTNESLPYPTLAGQVNFHNNVGTIFFAGKLVPRGEYLLETSMGTIDVLIPPDSSFNLTATAMGTLTNEFGSTHVGPAPHASLKLKSNLGTVSIRKL